MKVPYQAFLVLSLLLMPPHQLIQAQSDSEFEFFDEDVPAEEPAAPTAPTADSTSDFLVEDVTTSKPATTAPPPPEEALEDELNFADSFEEDVPPTVEAESQDVPQPEVLEENEATVQANEEIPLPEVVADPVAKPSLEVAPAEQPELPVQVEESVPVEVAPAPYTEEPMPEPLTPVSEPATIAVSPESKEEPDYRRERRFHEIFMKYNQSPTSQELWGQATGQTAQEYIVQKGDTLWSISKTLFNDTEFWPKIWSLNVQIISNPHEIKPGMKVSFIEGSFEEPPLLNLLAAGSAPGEDVVELANPEVAKEKLSKHKYRTAQPIPQSLPEYRNGYYARTSKLKFEIKKFDYPKFPEVISTYVESSPLVGVGRVVETELGQNSAGENQNVFVRVKPGETARTFQVLNSNIKIPLASGEKAPKAYVYELLGIVELMELTNAAENIYRARVTQSFSPIVRQSLLRPDTGLPMMKPTPGMPGSVPFLKVIGGTGPRQEMFGDNSYVFLSKGSNHGVQVDQEYNIYANNLVRNPNSLAKEGDRVIGRLKIVKVSENVSTAYVLAIEEPLMTQDYAGNLQNNENLKQ